MLIGYARVSTVDQHLDLQKEALKQAGCAKIYEDTMSGLRANRPGLDQAVEHLREGDRPSDSKPSIFPTKYIHK